MEFHIKFQRVLSKCHVVSNTVGFFPSLEGHLGLSPSFRKQLEQDERIIRDRRLGIVIYKPHDPEQVAHLSKRFFFFFCHIKEMEIRFGLPTL